MGGDLTGGAHRRGGRGGGLHRGPLDAPEPGERRVTVEDDWAVRRGEGGALGHARNVLRSVPQKHAKKALLGPLVDYWIRMIVVPQFSAWAEYVNVKP